MAKRRNDHGDELPFVALMDTMTNVVGVLTIVLVMMGISIAHAVRKVLTDLVPATAAQVAQVQTSLEQTNAGKKSAETEIASLANYRADPGVAAELKLLEEEWKEKNIKLFDIPTLQKESTARAEELAKQQSALSAMITERDSLKALLDKMPSEKPAPPKVVRIPNSRDIPKNAKLYYCYIRGKQAYLVDPITAHDMVMDAFDKEKRNFIHQRVKVPRALDRIIYDQIKVVNHFAKLNLTVRGQSIRVPENKFGTTLNYQIDFGAGKGDATLDDMNQPKGRFHEIAYKLSSYNGIALIFKVNPDGFETYLKAREIADIMRIPCGWEVDGNTVFNGPLEFEVNRLAEPPPPGPPGPAAPPAPPPPKQRLD